MTCATCKGAKEIRRIVRVREPSLVRMNAGVAPKTHDEVRSPCPDCTPRPFIRAINRGLVRFESGGAEYQASLDFDDASPFDAYRVADLLNAAVEQREAKLRGTLGLAANAVADAIQHYREQQGFIDIGPLLIGLSDHLGGCTDYIDGHVACGIAWDLGAAWWIIRVLQLANEAVVGRGVYERETLAPFLRGLGLMEVTAPGLESYSDEAIELEFHRREELGRIAHVFAEYEYGWQNDPDGRGYQTITGRSHCGKSLQVGGNWTAVTEEEADRGGNILCPHCANARRFAGLVHMRRGPDGNLSVCPHGHGGEVSSVLSDVTCDDCRQLHNGAAAPAPQSP